MTTSNTGKTSLQWFMWHLCHEGRPLYAVRTLYWHLNPFIQLRVAREEVAALDDYSNELELDIMALDRVAAAHVEMIERLKRENVELRRNVREKHDTIARLKMNTVARFKEGKAA
jgi:hypothetical protein